MGGFLRTLPRMTRVRIRANVAHSGLELGQEITVEKTDYVERTLTDGKSTLLEEFDDEQPPGGHPPVNADPEPGDPDFDEYDSTFDEELPAPLPPKRKGQRG